MESGKKFDPTLKAAIAIALTFIIAFSLGNVIGASKNITIKNVAAETDEASVSVVAPAPSYVAPATQPTEASQPQIIPTETTAPTTGAAPVASTSAPASTTQAPSSSSKKPETKAEIIAYFNDSVNKVKTDASKVTRNYEHIQHNSEKLELPSLLKKTGDSLISKFVKDNDTPEAYSTKEEIIANYPVHDETYASKATEADVKEATITDDGSTYTVTLKFNDSTDPANGTGVGAAFNCMKTQDVMDAASFIVKTFSIYYYDCVVVAKIDKATGRVVSAVYTTPEVMDVASTIGINAKVGLTFSSEYVIEY